MIIGDTVLQMLLTEEQRMLAPNGAHERLPCIVFYYSSPSLCNEDFRIFVVS